MKFVCAYGDALMQWSNIEFVLAIWFRKIAMIPDWRGAYAVFFSARSFQGRSEMFGHALEHAKLPPELLTFLREGLAKAIAYNTVRNEIAHGFVRPGDEGEEAKIAKPGRYWHPGNIGLSELEAAAKNFYDLWHTLYDAHEHMVSAKSFKQRGLSLSASLERLRELPNEACSSALSRRQRGRLRQLQSALRGGLRKK